LIVLFDELDAVRRDGGFRLALDALIDRWKRRGVGLEAVEAIFRFLEAYPDLDHGAPGPLVHFAERFYGQGYEAALLRSFDRKPTSLTAWMVNRVLNGTAEEAVRDTLLAALEKAFAAPSTETEARIEIGHYLSRMCGH
jgi:hypothetical protein